MSRAIRIACALSAARLVYGCGEDAAPQIEVQSGRNAVEAEIDVRGGVLELESRARVTLPADALPEATRIRAEVGDLKDLPPRPAGFDVIGEPLVITPHGLRLERAATIEVAIDDLDSDKRDVRVLRLEGGKDRTWEELDDIGVWRRVTAAARRWSLRPRGRTA